MGLTAIIDYTLGNLRSVYNAVEITAGNAKIVNKPSEIKNASHVILPGVGSFNDGISRLIDIGWDVVISEHIQAGKPFLGICLGMQLLASEGYENGKHLGLNLIKGCVKRLSPNNSNLPIPHIGWNDVTFLGSSKLSKDLDGQEDFYFVHSFVFLPEDDNCITGTCDYGGDFSAVIEKDNIFATQFHPEKSQKAGLTILRNFLATE